MPPSGRMWRGPRVHVDCPPRAASIVRILYGYQLSNSKHPSLNIGSGRSVRVYSRTFVPVVLSFIVAAAWVAAAAMMVLPLLAPAARRPTLAECGVASTLGACTAGAAWLLGLNFWGHSGAIACSVATLIAGSAAALAFRRRRVVPCAPRDSRRTIVLSLVLAIWASPVIAGALLMAPGPFPARFFNVDTPFRLVHVRELLRGSAFPPASLSNADVSSANHYGGPAASAAIGTASGLPAHTALFGVTLPVAMLGLFSATLLMTRRIVRKGSLTLRVAVLLMLLTTWLWPLPEFADVLRRAFSTASVAPVRDFAAHVWRDPQSFNNLFEDATHLFGRTLFLLACMPLVAPSSRTLWAGAYAVVLLGQVKTGHALIAGIALGVAGTLEALRTRRWSPVLPPLMAAAGTLALIRLGRVDNLFWLTFEPGWMVRHFPDVTVRHVLSFVWIVGFPAASCLIAGVARTDVREVARRASAPLLAACSIYLFFNLVGAWSSGRSWLPGVPRVSGPFDAFLEPLLQMHTLFGVIGGIILTVLWGARRRRTQWAILATIAILTVPAMLHRVRGTVLMLTAPELAHEHVDNRQIAAALAAIPVQGSIVASNDLRYPANDYARDLTQYQIPAVMGHQAFALPGYDRYTGWDERVLLQRALAQPTVPCETLEELARRGVTHILLHTKWSHPASLPLAKTYQGVAYVVYELGSQTRCGGLD